MDTVINYMLIYKAAQTAMDGSHKSYTVIHNKSYKKVATALVTTNARDLHRISPAAGVWLASLLGTEVERAYYCCGGIYFGWTARSVATVGGLTGLSLQKAFESILIEGPRAFSAFTRAEFEELEIHTGCLIQAREHFEQEAGLDNCVYFKDIDVLLKEERRMVNEVECENEKVTTKFLAVHGTPPYNEFMSMMQTVFMYQRTFCPFFNCSKIACEIVHFLYERDLRFVVELGSGRCVLGLICCHLMPTLDWVFTDAGARAKQPAVEGKGRPLEDAVVAINKLDAQVLVLCWPPMKDNEYDMVFWDMASPALAAFRGDFLIYLGEGRDGCNAHEEFFDILGREWVPLAVLDGGARIWDCRSWAVDLCWCFRRRITNLLAHPPPPAAELVQKPKRRKRKGRECHGAEILAQRD